MEETRPLADEAKINCGVGGGLSPASEGEKETQEPRLTEAGEEKTRRGVVFDRYSDSIPSDH